MNKFKEGQEVWVSIPCDDEKLRTYAFNAVIKMAYGENMFPPFMVQPLPIGSMHMCEESDIYETKNGCIEAMIKRLESFKG